MLIIQRNQLDTWFQQNEPAFVEMILQKVRKLYPTYRQTDAMLRESIRAGIRRARANGLISDRHISEFVLIMFEIAPNFDQQKDIRCMLDDTNLSMEERWDRLFTPAFDKAWDEADEPSFYDANAWYDEPPPDLAQAEWPTEQEWAELVAIYKIQQTTPPGQPVRDPTLEEINQALIDIRKRIASAR